MAEITLSPQEIERVTVFQYAQDFPIFEDDGRTLAYLVNPANGRVVGRTDTVDATVHYVLHHGVIAYAVGEAPDENGEELYWTRERLQRLFDTNRRQYMCGA